jgi:Asp-tRNA(Asn)/Glu-tRNA(Gln) amidotransferase A subunit family amidase
MSDLIQLSLPEISDRISRGTVTSEALTRAFLDQCDKREPEVQAFEYLDQDYALAQRRAVAVKRSVTDCEMFRLVIKMRMDAP